MNKVELTDKINTIDQHGEPYQVLEYTEYIDATIFEDSQEWEEKDKKYSLANGSNVNRISETVFEIVGSGVRLTRQ